MELRIAIAGIQLADINLMIGMCLLLIVAIKLLV